MTGDYYTVNTLISKEYSSSCLTQITIMVIGQLWVGNQNPRNNFNRQIWILMEKRKYKDARSFLLFFTKL